MSNGDLIGRGWRFPITVGAHGGLSWSEGPGRVEDAIWLVLATGFAERVMLPRFGAGVADFVLRSNSAVTRTELADAIREALSSWEPRIELEAVRVDPVEGEPSQVLVAIDYRLRSTNELFNLVYPLYLQEGVS